ncbi:putative chloride channel [Sphingomonas changbaiensis NBRC 104936]|uniref:Putative chloride channel n=1 Tax=Sphingomonas changbaiensis NBRC 104936 TaxID=1219043 RepID=A0A0E9MMB6_9SPHN|nr:chloride channel protein [Sphingomonas changbaiensis]GAO38907.1 putative chloride channel [Sphingomonas changbaiensis NBRC 104936]
MRTFLLILASIRRLARTSEAGLIVVAILVGSAAGLLAAFQGAIAHGLQTLLYGLGVERLSAVEAVDPVRLLALPVGGLLLTGIAYLARRRRAPIDVVEANALHGGAIPATDSLLVSAQTIVSNGFGASVGLEAAYAQAGGGLASVLGTGLKLRRSDQRILVGAGAGAAIGAAFGAPLTGAFYAFEIVIGAYTPAAIAPVAAAALAAVLVVRGLGLPAYLTVLPGAEPIGAADYVLYSLLGIVCAVMGVALMRAITTLERGVRRSPIPERWRPVLGGALLIPLALMSPQVLSAGHGALHLDMTMGVAVEFLASILVLKMLASAVSLSFGFRGGLFFASLFLGSLTGQIFAALLPTLPGLGAVDPTDAALIGMASFAVAVVGGPMTMSMLVLETTHDFALTGVAITAGLCASTFVRQTFGFSFSTWRLHTRGETIRSARDVGWARTLTAGRMMRKGVATAEQSITIAEFRRRFPLGSTGQVVLVDHVGHYAGLVPTSSAYASELDEATRVSSLATLTDVALRPEADVTEVMKTFEATESDDLAVIDEQGCLLGRLSERHVHRRYTDELEKAQRELFGEGER